MKETTNQLRTQYPASAKRLGSEAFIDRRLNPMRPSPRNKAQPQLPAPGTAVAPVFCWLLSVLVLLALAPSVLAQATGSATLRGVVTDPNGAVITGASVTLINTRTNDRRETTTGADGGYVFSAVIPGVYSVKVEQSGFKTFEQQNVMLSPADTRGLDITLEVGAPTEVVTVEATAEVIQKETGAKENTITARQIDNLSIISRSSLELLRILPGVVAPDGLNLESVSFGGGANANNSYFVNGLRGENNNVTVDGSRVMDIGSNNGTMITANPDMVQEVKVQTSNYAAEHGTSGVQITATTKSGSGGFHGTLYEYVRDWHFNANDRSNNYANVNNRERPKSKYHYPGGNIGGPLLLPWTSFNKNRDKLFFFVGYEYQYQRVDTGSFLSFTPTERQRRGDFSELSTAVTVPGGCTVNGVGPGNPAPNNNIAPCIDPIGRALINLYPLPNLSGRAENYAYSALSPTDRNQLITRVDYNVTEKTKLYARFAREYEEVDFARGLWWTSSSYELPSHVLGTNLGRSFSLSVVNLFNPTMTNEILFSASRLKLDNDYKDPDKVSLQALGIQNFPAFFPLNNPYVPVNIATWGSGDLYNAYGYPIFAYNDSYAITDNLTKVLNAHNLKFGFTIEQANKTQTFNNPTMQFELAQWGQPNGTGNNFGDLLVGRPIQVGFSTHPPTGHWRYYNYEFYSQDSWKVRPSFTLEYGLRVAYMPANAERNGLAVRFDANRYDRSQGLFINGDRTRPNGILLASRGEIPKGITENVAPRVMPRLNFAWDINGRGNTVIRGGSGIFYNRVQGNYEYYIISQPPHVFSAVANHWAQGDGLSFANLRNVDPFSALAAINITSRNPTSIEHPMTMNFSLSVARRMPFEQVLEVGYVGTQGRHLPQNYAFNFVPVGRLLSGTLGNADLSNPVHRAALDDAAVRTVKPFPVYNNVTYNQFTGTSTYHSLQATLSRQAGKGLQYFATYTFSKALGTTATNETDGAAFADPIDTRGRSWGVLPHDRTHTFNLSYNWEIPDMARGSFENGFTKAVLNGWQMSGITTIQSGRPIRLRLTGPLGDGDAARAWFGTDAFIAQGQNSGAITPIYRSNPQISGGGNVGDRMFDLNAFQLPSFPNSGPYAPPFYLRTPNRANFDVSFFKNFNFTERQKLQFRVGMFNVFNQAYPSIFDITNPTNSDIHLRLETVCNRMVNGIPNGLGATVDNVCDPLGGYSFSQDTINNFGRIRTKRGHRVIEFAFKYYF